MNIELFEQSDGSVKLYDADAGVVIAVAADYASAMSGAEQLNPSTIHDRTYPVEPCGSKWCIKMFRPGFNDWTNNCGGWETMDEAMAAHRHYRDFMVQRLREKGIEYYGR